MKSENIVFQTKLSGYEYVFDTEGFINVYDKEIKRDRCIYRIKAECTNQKEFELEVIYVGQKVYELCFG